MDNSYDHSVDQSNVLLIQEKQEEDEGLQLEENDEETESFYSEEEKSETFHSYTEEKYDDEKGSTFLESMDAVTVTDTLSHATDTDEQHHEKSETADLLTVSTLAFEDESITEKSSFIATSNETITVLPKKKSKNKNNEENSDYEVCSDDEDSDEVQENSNNFNMILCVIIVLVILLTGGTYAYVKFYDNSITAAVKVDVIDTKENEQSVKIDNDLPKISELATNHMKNEDVQTKIVLRNAEKENFMWSEQIVEEIQSYMKEHINDHPLLNDDVTVGKFNEIANEVKASIEGKHSRAQLIKCTDAIGEATKEQLDDDWKKIDECNSIAQNTAFTDEIQQAISNREEKLRIKNDSKINQDNNRPKIKFKKNIKECCGCISFHIVLVISHFITVILAWVAPEPSHVYIIITLIFSDLFFGILFLTFFCVMCDNTIEDKKILQILLTIVTALIFSFNVIATKDAYEYKSTFKCCHWSMNAFVMSIICCIAYAFIVALQTLEFNCK